MISLFKLLFYYALVYFIIFMGIYVMVYGVGLVKQHPSKFAAKVIRKTIRAVFKAIRWLLKKTFEYLGVFAKSLVSSAPTGSSDAFGTGSFMGFFDRLRFLSRRNDGLVIDGVRRISEEASYKHLALIAPTGAGKTSSLIIPNMLLLEHSMAITDPSGEVHRLCAGHLESKGFTVKVIDVTNVAGSLRFNPLHRASNHSDLRKIADVIVTSAFPDSSGDSRFWNDSARNLLSILLRTLKNDAPQYQNLANLKRLVDSIGDLDPWIARNADETTFREYRAFISQNDRVLQSVVSTARTALEAFGDPEICELTATETLHFESLRTEKTALFIIVPEDQIRFYRFFLSLLYVQIFSFCMEREQPGKPYHPVFVLLEEAGNMGRIPGFATLITTLRKRKVSVSIILQDEEQLIRTYGKADAHTILNGGCASKLYLPGLSLETCQALEKTLGKHGVIVEEESGRRREISRSLMTADEIRTMSEALFIHGNRRPIRLHMTPYYQNRKLLARTQIEPTPMPQGINRPVQYLPLDDTTSPLSADTNTRFEPEVGSKPERFGEPVTPNEAPDRPVTALPKLPLINEQATRDKPRSRPKKTAKKADSEPISRTEAGVGGYKVQVRYRTGNEEDEESRRQAVSKVIAKAMQRMKGEQS